MKIKEKAIEFINQMQELEILQIPHNKLKLAIMESIETTDRGTIAAFFEYLKETKLIEQISNGQQPVYEIKYANKEKLEGKQLAWLMPKKD